MHDAFNPAMVHELMLLISSIAVLVKIIWPNGIFR